MRCIEVPGVVVFVVLGLWAVPALAGPESSGRAGRLSAALGGTLDSELGEAAALKDGFDYASVTPRAGRGEDYRREVAKMQVANRPRNGDRPL